MKGKINFFTSLLLFAAGVTLIVLHSKVDILQTIVVFLGVVFIIPAVVTILVGAFTRSRRAASLTETVINPDGTTTTRHPGQAVYITSLVVSIFAIGLGVAMVLYPAFFAAAITYLFASLLIAAGIYHVIVVAWLARPVRMPFYFYIVPVLLIAAGVTIFCIGEQRFDDVIVLVTGIAMIASSISSLMEYIAMQPQKRIKE